MLCFKPLTYVDTVNMVTIVYKKTCKWKHNVKMCRFQTSRETRNMSSIICYAVRQYFIRLYAGRLYKQITSIGVSTTSECANIALVLRHI